MMRMSKILALALLWGVFYGAVKAEEMGEITLPREKTDAGSLPRAEFSHAVHRIQFKCYVCHDALFKMQAGADHINMDGVREGRFCGVCHDGETAFAVGFNTCNRCHKTESR